MRLGEIGRIVRAAANSTNQLVIRSEPIYGGQAYRIEDFDKLTAALKVLSEQAWNTTDYAPLKTLLEKVDTSAGSVELSQEDFTIISDYVDTINAQLPMFLSIVDSVIEPQDEQVINVKLPSNIHTLASLNRRNARLNTLFKEFTVDGEVRLLGFDKGSDWYVIYLTGYTTYYLFIGCLKIAQEYFKAREAYFNSEKAQLDYEAAARMYEREVDDENFTKYQEARMELEVQKRVRKLMEETEERNGHEEEELHTKLVVATKDLVKELGDNVEFHLSLNPPAYANETANGLSIDYKKLRDMKTEQADETKALDSSNNDMAQDEAA